jgi:GNAT superfamily N-acetyltransferase
VRRPGNRRLNKITIDIRPLSHDRLPDLLSFFEDDAFSDNREWSSCYCQCYYEDHSQVVWEDRTAAQNRALACERAANGQMQGYLAYVGGRVAGWCNAAPRHLLRALDAEPTPDAEQVGAIACFLVAPQFRGQGVSTSLLVAACEGLRSQGLRIA